MQGSDKAALVGAWQDQPLHTLTVLSVPKSRDAQLLLCPNVLSPGWHHSSWHLAWGSHPPELSVQLTLQLHPKLPVLNVFLKSYISSKGWGENEMGNLLLNGAGDLGGVKT